MDPYSHTFVLESAPWNLTLYQKIPLLFIIITVNSLNFLNHSRISAKDPDLFPGYVGTRISFSSSKELLLYFPSHASKSHALYYFSSQNLPRCIWGSPHFPLPSYTTFNSSAIFLLLLPCIGDFFVFFHSLPHFPHNQMIFSISLHSHSIPSLSGTFLMAALPLNLSLSAPNCVLSFPGNRNSVV